MSSITEYYQIRRPSNFLSLIPTTSASYPQRPSSPPSTSVSLPKLSTEAQSPPAAAAIAATTAQDTPAVAVATTGTVQLPVPTPEEIELGLLNKHRRSSSLASDESGSKMRFLKLGPVHWGEGDGTGDWSEVGVTE